MITTLPQVLSLTRPLLGFDLETTGTNPRRDRIVEIGLEIMRPGFETKEYRTLVNPGVPIPAGATAIHGITDEMVADAPKFEDLAQNLLSGFAGADFAGYNVRFDLQMVQAEFTRARLRWTPEGARVIDGFRLWQVAEQRTLEHAANRWLKGAVGVDDAAIEVELGDFGKAHNALWDVKMSTRIIAAQLAACPTLPRDLDALHELCSPGWYDAEGKLQWKDGELVFSFGEHRGVALRQVPMGYFKWILSKDFSDKVKDVCRGALDGVFPTREVPTE